MADTINYEAALPHFESAAALGHPKALFQVGQCYSVLKEYEKALQWWQLAAATGDRDAKRALSDFYTNYHEGVDLKLGFGFMFRKQAADNGDKQAQYNLGMELLKKGNLVDAIVYLDQVCDGPEVKGEEVDPKLKVEAALECFDHYLNGKPQDLGMARMYSAMIDKAIKKVFGDDSENSKAKTKRFRDLYDVMDKEEKIIYEQKKEEARREGEYIVDLQNRIGTCAEDKHVRYLNKLKELFAGDQCAIPVLASGKAMRKSTSLKEMTPIAFDGLASILTLPILTGAIQFVGSAARLKLDALMLDEAKKQALYIYLMKDIDKKLEFKIDFWVRLAVKLTFLQREALEKIVVSTPKDNSPTFSLTKLKKSFVSAKRSFEGIDVKDEVEELAAQHYKAIIALIKNGKNWQTVDTLCGAILNVEKIEPTAELSLIAPGKSESAKHQETLLEMKRQQQDLQDQVTALKAKNAELESKNAKLETISTECVEQLSRSTQLLKEELQSSVKRGEELAQTLVAERTIMVGYAVPLNQMPTVQINDDYFAPTDSKGEQLALPLLRELPHASVRSNWMWSSIVGIWDKIIWIPLAVTNFLSPRKNAEGPKVETLQFTVSDTAASSVSSARPG